MRILSCECTSAMSNDFENIEKYCNRYYEVLLNTKGAVTIKIFCSQAGGVFYTEGSAKIVDGCLSLKCGTRANAEIQFESIPWEVTFAITYDGELPLDIIYFEDNEVTGPEILRIIRNGS